MESNHLKAKAHEHHESWGLGFTHRPQSRSFLGLPYRILNISPKRELLRGLWVGPESQVGDRRKSAIISSLLRVLSAPLLVAGCNNDLAANHHVPVPPSSQKIPEPQIPTLNPGRRFLSRKATLSTQASSVHSLFPLPPKTPQIPPKP